MDWARANAFVFVLARSECALVRMHAVPELEALIVRRVG